MSCAAAFRILVLASMLALAACAHWKRIERPPQGSLVVGETKRADVVAMLGEPMVTREFVFEEQNVDFLWYYDMWHAKPRIHGIEPRRDLVAYFLRDVLVAFRFNSSFEADHTYFDMKKVDELKEGEKCDTVFEKFGPAYSQSIYPVIKEKDAHKYSYFYIENYPRMLLSRPREVSIRLDVLCDHSGRIAQIDFEAKKR